MDDSLAQELLAMARRDTHTRRRLAETGELFEGYHPDMERVHVENARRFCEILDEQGWPGRSLVGEEAADAAWLVVQHAISLPEFQRRALDVLKREARRGEVSPAQVAMLEDRIRVFEGKQQIYGTQVDWDEDGELSPQPIVDPDRVDERRAAVGLEPLAEATRRVRERAASEGESPPKDWRERKREMEAWCREVGWRDDERSP